MADVSRYLLEGHKTLATQLERVIEVAASVGEAPPDLLQRNVEHVYDFLYHHLLPHALAEEQALYPLVGKILGTPQATTTMSCDHAAISRLVNELRTVIDDSRLSGLSSDRVRELPRLLYSIHTLVTHHLAKEEEVYFPLLDIGLTEAEAHQLMDRMHEVERNVGGAEHS